MPVFTGIQAAGCKIEEFHAASCGVLTSPLH